MKYYDIVYLYLQISHHYVCVCVHLFTYSSPLNDPSEHDDDGDVLLPDHPPEVRHSVTNRT